MADQAAACALSQAHPGNRTPASGIGPRRTWLYEQEYTRRGVSLGCRFGNDSGSEGMGGMGRRFGRVQEAMDTGEMEEILARQGEAEAELSELFAWWKTWPMVRTFGCCSFTPESLRFLSPHATSIPTRLQLPNSQSHTLLLAAPQGQIRSSDSSLASDWP
jgi:hypothetical protein